MGEDKANSCGDTLFTILPQRRYTALARAAEESQQADAGHDVEFHSLKSRSILNKSVSKRLHWMAWSINPYRGCEFGCRYCYARYTHEFLAPAAEARREAGPSTPLRSAQDDEGRGLRSVQDNEKRGSALNLRDPDAFERRIFVKENAAWLLEQDIRRLAKQGRLHEEMALGTATDPWQPIERRTRLTRTLLEVMARHDGLRIGMVTKSTLIARDIDLLQEIHRRSTLVVHITITTPDADLTRKLEPRAPRPDLRFETVRRLRAAGLQVGILNSPLLPGITDSAEAIDNMALLARQADASFFAAMPLFLKPCSRPTYFEFVREHFPHLQVLYAEKFRDMDFAARPYRERLSALVRASCQRHGLRERIGDNLLTRDAGEERKGPGVTMRIPAQGQLFG